MSLNELLPHSGPSGQTGQEEKCLAMGHGFRGEHLCKEESSGPCSELPVICLHSCVISKVMRVRANTAAERHAGSVAESVHTHRET